MEESNFGYPAKCGDCEVLQGGRIGLKVPPFYKRGVKVRIMLVGQDPTIAKKQERVKRVLMLDDENSQMSRWIRSLFVDDNWDRATIYATNCVKCTFIEPPSRKGGIKFLASYFGNCKKHLIKELSEFKPEIVITFGEPSHKLFIALLDNYDQFPMKMREAFTGKLVETEFKSLKFHYSPCIHINTYNRWRKIYGDSLDNFKDNFSLFFNGSNRC